MDNKTADRYGNKRAHQRVGSSAAAAVPDRANKVCYHWRAGRCNRHPCPFVHSELPAQLDGVAAKRTHHHGLVWRNPNSGGGNSTPSSKWGKGPGGGAATGQGPGQGASKGGYRDRTSIGVRQVVFGEPGRICSGMDCQSGQCVGIINLGGQIGCMISEGPWVFIGIPHAVKAWNTQTAIDLSLSGPAGQVYALAVGNMMVFAGTQGGRILAWKFSAVGNCFEPAASLSGHQLAVVSLVVGAMRLYSGSMDRTIKVWDLATLQCIQTLTDHVSVVMSVLCWDQFLLSCSLDQTIKGVLALCGMHDAQARPVLPCSCNDNSTRIYDLPAFSERGKIFSKEEMRAIQIGPGGLFFTGEGTGELKVWKWLTNETPTS